MLPQRLQPSHESIKIKSDDKKRYMARRGAKLTSQCTVVTRHVYPHSFNTGKHSSQKQ